MSSTRYVCVHCGHRFEQEGGGELRCPKCLRASGLEQAEASRARARPAWVLPAVVGGALLAVGVGYAAWAATSADVVGDEVPTRPLRTTELRGHLRRLALETPAGAVASLLEADAAITRFARGAVDGVDGEVARARAVVDALRARASKGAFVRWPRSSPRETPVEPAAAAFARLAEDGAGVKLYPLEAAAIAVAALRSVGVDAMVAEIYAFPAERAPVDPSGKLGYFGVAVFPSGTPGEGAPVVLDPFEGHGEPPAASDVAVKTDVEAIGAALGHLAMHRMVTEADPSKAFELSRAALRADPRSPALRSAFAAITLVGGGAESARQELEAAAQLRPDAPRKTDLAGLALAEGDYARAAREVGAVLERHPEYAGARATLAAVHLAMGEAEAARAELEKAERIDPALHNLPLLWANYYLATHQGDLAAQKALDAVEVRPFEWQRRLQAAKVLRTVGRYEEMRRQARAALDLVPDGQKDAIRGLMLDDAVLGPTALDEPLEEVAEADALPLPEPDGEGLELGGGSLLLGGGDRAPAVGLGADTDLGGGPLLKLGDPSTLELRDPGTELRLDGLGAE